MPGNTIISQKQFLTEGKLTHLFNPSGNHCQEVLSLLTNVKFEKKKKKVRFAKKTNQQTNKQKKPLTLETILVL